MKERSSGTRRVSVFMAVALLCSFFSVSAWAEDSAAEAERIVDTSRRALESFMADPQMSGFRNRLKNAKAVLIIV
jgi:outer membrane lipoprotein-sorting protein